MFSLVDNHLKLKIVVFSLLYYFIVNLLRYDTIQYDTMLYITMQYITKQYDMIQYNQYDMLYCSLRNFFS